MFDPLPSGAFCFETCDASAAPEKLARLAEGSVAAIHVQDYVSGAECRRIVERFHDPRAGRRARGDGVGGEVVGPSHYGKPLAEYFLEVTHTTENVEFLLGASPTCVDRVQDLLGQVVSSRGQSIRRASWLNKRAGQARALSWPPEGEYLLAPHDDAAQLHHAAQLGFEIQQAIDQLILAVNLYISVPPQGGQLRLWNGVLSSEDRKDIGIDGYGYPYPPHLVEALPHFDIDVASGSLVIINGALPHAVLGYHTPPTDLRLVINFFVGEIDDTTVVTWV
jgi:hypothetical protein